MRKVLLSLLIVIIPTPAFADGCPSGKCEVIVNGATGEVIWKDAEVAPAPIKFVAPEPSAPSHVLNVQTNNQSWGTSGTPEQIAEAVQTLIPKPLTADPCLNSGCNELEVNATTGIKTLIPLNEADLKQRAKDQVVQSQRQAELAKSAYQALPNITAWQLYDPLKYEIAPLTLLDKTLTPEWWESWIASLNSFYASMFWWWVG